MIEQPTFAELEFHGKKRKTRRELLFRKRMEVLIPWGSVRRSESGLCTPRPARAAGPIRWP